MHLGIDMDNVVVDFVGGIEKAIEREFGRTVSLDEYNFALDVDPIVGQSWWKWLENRDLWHTFPPVQGALGGMDHLRMDGHHLELITAKPRWAEKAVWRWVAEWLPPVHRVTIGTIDKKTLKTQPKSELSDADVLIDDHPANIEEFSAAGGVGILFAHRHNRGAELPPDTYRAAGWDDVEVLVAEIERRGY